MYFNFLFKHKEKLKLKYFQRRFNWLFNVGLVMCVSMSYMNIIMALSEPKHHCQVPGRESYNLTVDEWKNLTLPR